MPSTTKRHYTYSHTPVKTTHVSMTTRVTQPQLPTTHGPTTTLQANFPTTAVVCRNKIGNCADYGSRDYACHEYEAWARNHCNQYCGFCVSVHIPTTHGPTTSVCADKISQCSNYGDPIYACKGQFEDWAKENCAKYCGYCRSLAMPTTALPMPTTQGVCKDKLSNCRQFGDKVYACSGQYEEWSKINCAQYCGFCHAMVTPTSFMAPTKHMMCEDKLPDCKDYGSVTYACSGNYEHWAMENCRKYCGFCGQTSNSTTVINCANLKADIQVLVDASPSIGISNFRKIKNFIYNFTNNLVIGNGNVLLGVTTYSDIIRSNFSMNKYENKDILLEAISNITYANIGVTHTGAAINFTVHSSFTEKHGDRRNVQNILITFTDGISSKTTSASALELVNSKIHSFVVGVGNFSRSVLEEIASGSDKVLRLENVSKLYSLTPFSACMQT